MQLVPWRPFFRESGLLAKDIDELWNRFLGGRPPERGIAREWVPTVDLSETKDAFIVRVELPGLQREDVNVTMTGDLLTIKGEKRQEEEDKDEHHHYIERYYGSFQRSFQLPANVEADRIEADLKDGVLSVTLPKTEETKQQEVEIKVN